MSKRKHQQVFKDEYEKLWPVLKKSELSENHVYCSICSMDVSISHGGKDDCRRHVQCKRHVEKAKISSTNLNLKNMFVKSDDLSVIKAETLFTNFLIEHNIPISASDHAGPLLKKMFPDSKIASKYGCGRTKTTAIIKAFAGKTQEEICEVIRKSKFSLATDGSNSSNDDKVYPILVTYFDKTIEKIVIMVLSLPKLSGNATGENIFNLLNSELQKFLITWENCIAFSSDNASNMVGKFKGVLKFIKEKNANIVFRGCTCHLVHLVAQHATKKLNYDIEEFLVDVHYYLKRSSNRTETLKMWQELCGTEAHKIMKYVSTRWLSLEKVINRFIEQWEPLRNYFSGEEGTGTYLRIKTHLQSPLSKLYLLFLQSVLPVFTKTNTILQQEAPYVHKLRREIISLYSECLSRFIKPSAILNADDVFKINIHDVNNQKSKVDLVIGSKTRQYVNDNTLSKEEKRVFFNCVRAFYEKACSYMLDKFPFHDEVLKHAEVCDLALRDKCKFLSIEFFIKLFAIQYSDEEKNMIEAEFVSYQMEKFKDEFILCNQAVAWNEIKQFKDHNGSKKYKILPDLILNILLLPHSNAACERIFSTIRKNQNEFRANLGNETLEALMIQKCKATSHNNCCYHTQFSEEELKRAKKATYLQNY